MFNANREKNRKCFDEKSIEESNPNKPLQPMFRSPPHFLFTAFKKRVKTSIIQKLLAQKKLMGFWKCSNYK
jgi:hypothetical protein